MTTTTHRPTCTQAWEVTTITTNGAELHRLTFDSTEVARTIYGATGGFAVAVTVVQWPDGHHTHITGLVADVLVILGIAS